MEKKMEKEKNIMIMVKYIMKVNIQMGKNGIEKFLKKMEKKNLR